MSVEMAKWILGMCGGLAVTLAGMLVFLGRLSFRLGEYSHELKETRTSVERAAADIKATGDKLHLLPVLEQRIAATEDRERHNHSWIDKLREHVAHLEGRDDFPSTPDFNGHGGKPP